MLDIVYQDSLSDKEGNNYRYIGMTCDKFRLRYSKHAQSFRNPKYAKETKLSKKIDELKAKEEWEGNRVKFKIFKYSKSYSPGMKSCQLCIDEKLAIVLYDDPPILLNSRIEMFNQCRHKARHKMDRFLNIGYSQTTQGD